MSYHLCLECRKRFRPNPRHRSVIAGPQIYCSQVCCQKHSNRRQAKFKTVGKLLVKQAPNPYRAILESFICGDMTEKEVSKVLGKLLGS